MPAPMRTAVHRCAGVYPSGEMIERSEAVLYRLALRIYQPQPRLGLHLAHAGHGCLALRSGRGHRGTVLGGRGEHQLVVITARQRALVQ